MATDTDTIEIDGVVYDLTPKTVVVDGITFTYRFRRHPYSGYLRTTVQIQMDQLRRVREIPFTDASMRGFYTIEIVDDDGTVVAEAHSLDYAKLQLDRIERLGRREAAKQSAQEDISHLRAKAQELSAKGLPTAQLDSMIRALPTMILYGWGLRRVEIQESIRRAWHEVERLEGDPIEVLVDEIMHGRLMTDAHEHNKAVIARLDALEIRSGGFIESITDEGLRRFYRMQLNGATHVDQLASCDLRLQLEDYAPADVVADLELAPESVELVGRKDSSSYSITYAYEQIDGEQVAVASMSVPLSVYERNCAEHGRKSNFPQIEGVRLMISVTVDGKEIARGEDGDQLKGKIKKYKGGRSRSKLASPELNMAAFIGGDNRPTEPPPWFTGRVRRR